MHLYGAMSRENGNVSELRWSLIFYFPLKLTLHQLLRTVLHFGVLKHKGWTKILQDVYLFVSFCPI